MSRKDQVRDLYRRFCEGPNAVARMLTIYVQEASDGYGTNSMKPISHFHKNIDDRIAAAHRMCRETEIFGEVLCDSMADDMLEKYLAFPDGISVVLNGVVVHEGGPPDEFDIYYNVGSVIEWFEKNYPSSLISKDQEPERISQSVCAT